MRTSAREAALNILFAAHFNEVTNDFKKKIYAKFGLESDEDLLFAARSKDSFDQSNNSAQDYSVLHYPLA
jgi:hypothetical protein